MKDLFGPQTLRDMFVITPIPKYSNYKGNSTKHGYNSKDVSKRRLKNRNNKTHRK